MMSNYPQELRADFQQFFGLDIEEIGKSYSLVHACELAAMLPEGSRVLRKIEPALSWDIKDHLLTRLINDFELFMWALGGGESEGNLRPTPIQPPKSKYEQSQSKFASMSADEFDAYVKRVRKEADRGN